MRDHQDLYPCQGSPQTDDGSGAYTGGTVPYGFHLEKRGHVNKRNRKGSSLLVGNIFCAHCGNRLTLTTSGRKKNRYTPMAKRICYQCRYNVLHPANATVSPTTPCPRWIPWSNRSCA